MERDKKNNLIIKNALLLYVRLFITMGISLFTSRIVLQTLGVTDFGVYNLVAGVVTTLTFLNISMSSATSRFLTYELDNLESLKIYYSSAINIHLCIAVIVFVVGELLGYYFIHDWLNLPVDRLKAAYFVYHFALLTACFSIMQVPYNAMIIAHEHINTYAYIDIISSVLKILSLVFLFIINYDHLVIYGFLLLAVGAIIFLTNYIYCKIKFSDCRYEFIWNSDVIRQMTSFSGWDMFGNASVLARTQGVNILLNLFFGTVINAATGIATQVQSAVMSFASSAITAFRPQIIKSYASGDYQRTVDLMFNAAKFSYLLLYCVSLPLIMDMKFVLDIWLLNPPNYTVIFCQYVLIFNLFANLSLVIMSVIHATGKIKRPSIINGTLYLSVIPVSYIMIGFFSGESVIPYQMNIVMIIIGIFLNLWTLKKHFPIFNFKLFANQVIGPCVLNSILLYGGLLWLQSEMNYGFIRFFTLCIVSFLLSIIFCYFFAMDNKMRKVINAVIVKFLRLKFHEH